LGTTRGNVAVVLIALAGILSLVGMPAMYVRGELLNEPHLQGRLATTLHSQDVRRVAAKHVVDGFTDAGVREVLTVRPLLVSAIEAFLDSPPFQLAVRAAAKDVHNVIVNERDESLILDIGEGGVRVASALRSVSPAVARTIPPGVSPPVIELDADAPVLGAVRILADLRRLGVILPLAALVLLAAGIALAAAGARRPLGPARRQGRDDARHAPRSCIGSVRTDRRAR
jgi:hypothetical protein